MTHLDIKPLSVNEAWKGRRIKTGAYKRYERDVLTMLPKIIVPDGALCVSLCFGFSSKSADADNPVKCFLDCLQKKYGFNDNRVYKLNIEKVDVAKGCEFVKFSIDSIS